MVETAAKRARDMGKFIGHLEDLSSAYKLLHKVYTHVNDTRDHQISPELVEEISQFFHDSPSSY